MKKILFYLLLLSSNIQAESKYPVGITYLVADLKYSQDYGVKICEIQQGILSTCFGDVYLNPPKGIVLPRFEEVLAGIPIKKWVILSDVTFSAFVNTLKTSLDWYGERRFSELIANPTFFKTAKKIPAEPSRISSYEGLLYSRKATPGNVTTFHAKYPGMIIMDEATHSYWIDKYKMSLLFNSSTTLSSIKPEWGLYPKQYSKELVEEIQRKIPAEAYVIKPRSGFLGNGVILLPSEDLDITLQYILGDKSILKNDKDKSYFYWSLDTLDTFIIEKFYPSDLVKVTAFNDQMYEPTMRAAFIMTYDNGEINFNFLSAWWSLPFKSLEENGTFSETRKAYCKLPYYTKVSEEVLKAVQEQLEETMPLLYEAMLENM